MRDRRELHLHCSCRIKSSFGLSVFWLASWTGRCPWLLVLLQRSSIPAIPTLPRVKERNAQTHAHTGSLWCVCVSVCEHLFRIRHLASFGRAGFTNEAPWTVICLDADQYPSRRTDQKQRKVQPLNFTVQYASLLLIIFTHTHRTHTQTMWISLCRSNIPESNFFLWFSVRIEIHCRLNWTLSPDCCNTPQ